MLKQTIKKSLEAVPVSHGERIMTFVVVGIVGFMAGWVADHWMLVHNLWAFCGY